MEKDYTVRLWDVNTGTLTRTLTGHTDWVTTVVFSPDGNTITSGSWDGTILLWALTQDTGEPSPPPPDRLEGFMTTEESIRWLKAQGYQVEENDNGYTIKRKEKIVTASGAIRIRDHDLGEIGWGNLIVLPTGVVIITDSSGGIRIKVSDSQSGSDD